MEVKFENSKDVAKKKFREDPLRDFLFGGIG